MANDYVNRNAQDNGDHEVHKQAVAEMVLENQRLKKSLGL